MRRLPREDIKGLNRNQSNKKAIKILKGAKGSLLVAADPRGAFVNLDFDGLEGSEIEMIINATMDSINRVLEQCEVDYRVTKTEADTYMEKVEDEISDIIGEGDE